MDMNMDDFSTICSKSEPQFSFQLRSLQLVGVKSMKKNDAVVSTHIFKPSVVIDCKNCGL